MTKKKRGENPHRINGEAASTGGAADARGRGVLRRGAKGRGDLRPGEKTGRGGSAIKNSRADRPAITEVPVRAVDEMFQGEEKGPSKGDARGHRIVGTRAQGVGRSLVRQGIDPGGAPGEIGRAVIIVDVRMKAGAIRGVVPHR